MQDGPSNHENQSVSEMHKEALLQRQLVCWKCHPNRANFDVADFDHTIPNEEKNFFPTSAKCKVHNDVVISLLCNKDECYTRERLHSINQLIPGDHIAWHRAAPGYWHHAIFENIRS